MTWEEAVAHALALPGAELGTSYGQPAVKAAGHAFLSAGREPETSFVLRIDRGTVALMTELHPATCWQTPHYQGWPAMLVRYTGDEAVTVDLIGRAHAQALAKRPPRQR